MKVAIVGSRSVDDRYYAFLNENIPQNASEIISGGAVGADTLAERYAQETGLKLTIIRPEYDLFQNQAPLVRNAQIVEAADYVLILWDSKSRGTTNVIMSCLSQKKPFRVFLLSNIQTGS